MAGEGPESEEKERQAESPSPSARAIKGQIARFVEIRSPRVFLGELRLGPVD